jgi:hypothetical protein
VQEVLLDGEKEREVNATVQSEYWHERGKNGGSNCAKKV